MAVNEPIRISGPFIGDGVLDELDFDFETLAVGDVSVGITNADDVEVLLALNTDYTVALSSGSAGGTITLLTPLATGTTAHVYGDAMPYVRTGNIISNPGGFFPAIVNAALDRVHVGLLQLAAKMSRAIQLPRNAEDYAGKSPVILPDGSVGWSSGTGADAGLRTALASPTGGEMVGFSQSGSASSRSTQAKNRETLTITDFPGVDPTGVADSTAGINLAIAQWKARGAAELIVPAGIYLLSDTVKFDHPRLGVLTCAGRFISTVSGKAAVQIGSDSAACYGLTVTGLSVQRSTLDMQPDGSTTNSIAVLLKNFVYSSVEIREAYNCTEGVRCLGTVLSGSFSLNRIYLGYVKDNKINVRLTATDGGYCNDNMFFGGSLGHSGSYPNFTGTINLLEDYYAANELNGNRFFGIALEDSNAACVAAEINGLNTLIVAPRMENSAGGVYPFKFTTHSQSCMLIGLGYEWFSEDIENLGAGNSWDSSDMLFRSARTPDAANIAVMMLQSRSTNLAKLLGGRDTSGNLTSYIRGDGHALLQRLNIANIPIYANNAAAVSGGRVSGDVYRTTTGEARVVTP